MPAPLDPNILSRLPPDEAARSWLGGAPRLGGAAWPRNAQKGRSLPFFGQLDLAEIAAAGGPAALPAEGSLAFFLGAVVFVPAGSDAAPTPPPADLFPLSEAGGEPHVRRDLEGRPLFPRWPVALTKIPLPLVETEDEDEAAEARWSGQRDAIAARFERRAYNLSVDAAFDGPPAPRWWRVGHHFADHLTARRAAIGGVRASAERSLQWAPDQVAAAASDADRRKAEASVKLYRDKLATYDGWQPVFEAWVDEVARWADGRDPWSLMADADWQQLIAWRARCPQFGDFTQYWGDPGVDELVKKAFDALPKRGEAAFDALPAEVRELIDAKRAPRPRWWATATLLADAVAAGLEAKEAKAVVPLRAQLAADRATLAQAASGLGGLWSRLVGKSAEVTALEAQVAARTDALAAEEAKLTDLRALAASLRDLAGAHAPWEPMSDAAWAELEGTFGRAKELVKYSLPYALRDLETLSLLLLAAHERGSQALPDAVRALIDARYRLPIDGCHQLFGVPTDVQGGAVPDHEEDYLLLQLSFDDLLLWSFGDNGVFQFWISPADLARRDWSKVAMTFECH